MRHRTMYWLVPFAIVGLGSAPFADGETAPAEPETTTEAPAAAGIPKWRKPNGGFHFGDDPPEGSVRVGEVSVPEAPRFPEIEPEKRETGAVTAAAPEGIRWSKQRPCDQLVEVNGGLSRNELGALTVSGSVTSISRQPLRNVQVCAEGVCTVIDRETLDQRGDAANFVLLAGHLDETAGDFPLEARCSVPR